SLTLRVGHDADDKPDSESQATWLEKAREKLDETKHLIKQTEKPYEPHTPDWPDWEPPEYVGVFEPGQRVGYHRRNADIEFLEAEIVGLESKDGLAWLSSDVGHGLTQMFTDRDSFRQMAQPGSVPI
ncbi:MAG: hypothetical protein CMJ78_14655, partial [Planctomycetaceae bacterium]|nr:hypothetical protein [Planctomycetaceae bacterium]